MTSPLLLERGIRFADHSNYLKRFNGKSFSESLSICYQELKKFGLTEAKLAEITDLQTSTISGYLTGKRLPSLYSLVAICIAMRLHISVSMLLINKAKHGLDLSDPIDSICYNYLLGCGYDRDFTVETCSRDLTESGFPDLHTIRDNAATNSEI